MDNFDRDFEATWAMHQCPEIVRLREIEDQDAEVLIPALLVCCTVMQATEIIEDKVIEVADRLIAATSPAPYAGIICPQHGRMDIDEAEYMRQLAKPDALWVCPRCGQFAEFDDTRFEHLQGISDEPDDEGRCTDPRGHDWQVSDTDRTYCTNCGADGDG